MSEEGFESRRTRYRVTGMDCGACAAKIENALLRLPGVSGASASATTGKLSVAHDGDPGIAQAIRQAVAQLGYGIASEDEAPASHDAHSMANIRQNIAIALGLKAVFLVTTVLGVTGLWPAILADTGATVLVTANAMRLLGLRLPFDRA
jgi:Zn2+/Cd2+-exporting ATPase